MRRVLGFLLLCFVGAAPAQEYPELIRVPYFASKKWALCIGTQNYTKISPLSYSAQDAIDFAGALESELGFDRKNVKVLSDAPNQVPANSANVANAIDSLLADRAMDAGDLFIVYFSGHGVGLADGDYWLPNDADPKSYSKGAIQIEALLKKLTAKKMRNVVVISDACRAGEKNTFGSKLLSYGRKSNIAVLLGCSPGSQSYESPKLKRGVFTNYLLKNIKNLSAVDRSTGALKMSAIGQKIAVAVEGFTKSEYGSAAQKPYIAADKDQDVVLASFPPADKEVVDFLADMAKIGAVSPKDARSSLILAAEFFRSNGSSEKALQVYRQLHAQGESSPNFQLHFYGLLCELRRTAEAKRIVGQMLLKPVASAWTDLLTIFAPNEAVTDARVANAAFAMVNSEFRDSILEGVDRKLAERNMKAERTLLWERMSKLPDTTIWPRYAELASKSQTSEVDNLSSLLAAFSKSGASESQVDAAYRNVYNGLLRQRRLDLAETLIADRLLSDKSNGFWLMRRAIVATVNRDAKRNDYVRELLLNCKDGTTAVGATFLLGPDARLFNDEFSRTADRLSNDFEAQVAHWVSASLSDPDGMAKISDRLKKLANSDYEQFSVPFISLSDAMERVGASEKIDPQKASSLNRAMALVLEEEIGEVRSEHPEYLGQVFTLLRRSDEPWRVVNSYLSMDSSAIEALPKFEQVGILENVVISMLNYGWMAAAESAMGQLRTLGAVDSYVLLRYALANQLSGDVADAAQIMNEVKSRKLTGIQKTLAALITIHQSITAKEQSTVSALIDGLDKNLEYNDGLKQYLHYLELLNNPTRVMTEESTKDHFAHSYEFHDLWSSTINIGIERAANVPGDTSSKIVDTFMRAVAEEPLNEFFGTLKYPGFPNTKDYAGTFQFSGRLVVPAGSVEGFLNFKVTQKGEVTGSIDVPSEKASVKLTGEVDEVGRVEGKAMFPGGITTDFVFHLQPAAILKATKSDSLPMMRLIMNSASPTGVAFYVFGRVENPKL